MDYIITTEQLTKKYKNFISVNKVSMHIQKGSIYGFLGPNGAGKSTTMKMLLGLTSPTGGSFTVDGGRFPDDRISILKKVGSFIESPSFYANLTGRENLDIIRRILGLPENAVDTLSEGMDTMESAFSALAGVLDDSIGAEKGTVSYGIRYCDSDGNVIVEKSYRAE